MSTIHIKASRRGLLHRELGVAQGTKIPRSRLESAKKGASKAEKKRIVFAENFGHSARHRQASTNAGNRYGK